jgi:hypothetical protein
VVDLLVLILSPRKGDRLLFDPSLSEFFSHLFTAQFLTSLKRFAIIKLSLEKGA